LGRYTTWKGAYASQDQIIDNGTKRNICVRGLFMLLTGLAHQVTGTPLGIQF